MAKEGSHTVDDSLGQYGDRAVIKGGVLANLILEAPERFANGDRQVAQESLGAVKAILDYALHSEPEALAAVGKYLGPVLDQSQGTQTRSKGGKKRKRNAANSIDNLWGLTPLDSMTVDHLNEEQIWSQIELKNEKMSSLIKAAMVDAEKTEEEEEMRLMMEEEEQDQAMDEVEKKKQKKKQKYVLLDDEDEDDLGAMPNEKIVHSLKDLSDADLQALGLDPSRRADLEKLEEMEDDSLEEEEEDNTFGYPGASDLSDDDEMHGKVVTEPLRTEEEQRKRQAQVAAEERRQMREQKRMRKILGMQEGQDEEEDGDEDEDEDEEEDDSDGEEDEEDSDDVDYAENDDVSEASGESGSDSDDSEEKDGRARSERNRLSSILDNLDSRESTQSTSKKWKTHPTLDDDFFSIDQFNRDTDDYGDEGITLGDDVDLFKSIEDEEEPILYSDFFAPPPGESSNGKQSTIRGSQTSVSSPPKQNQGENTIGRKTSVRFHDEVSVRRIKSRKNGEMEITPELLKAMQDGVGSDDEEDGFSDDDDEEDDEDEVDADEVEEQEDIELQSVDSEEEAEGMEVDSSDEGIDGSDEEELDVEQDSMDGEEMETVQRVAGDLFADEEMEMEVGKEQQSGYQKRLEKLQQEISRLERENVSKKDWTLMGETGSRARPENSLLAEPLDFENNNRAKPVITPETTSTLEDLIKKRILESSFDNVERRANIQAFDFLPSKMLELSDTKSSKSLDQVYEDELGLGTGVNHGEKMDKQLEQDHQEISRLYDELEYRLDALSNAHFTPKAPKATIKTISNTPTITMEESLPSTSNHASQLAPEEVYDSGRHNATLQGERSEMTPEEKKRLQKQLRGDKKARNQRIESVKQNVEINKQAFAKNRGGRFVGSGKKGSRNDAIEKQDALNKLLGNKGVSVVGKGNEDKKRRQDTTSLNASHYKL